MPPAAGTRDSPEPVAAANAMTSRGPQLPPSPTWRFTQRDRCAAFEVDLLELPIGEEGDPLTVRREERTDGVRRPRNRHRIDGVQKPLEQLRPAAAARHVDDPRSVGRDHRARKVEPTERGRRGSGTTKCAGGTTSDGAASSRSSAHRVRSPSRARRSVPTRSHFRSSRNRQRLGVSRGVLELEAGVGDVSQPLFRITLQTSAQHARDRRRRIRRNRRPVHGAFHHGRDRVRRGGSGKGGTTDDHFVDDATERPDVGAAIDLLSRGPARGSCTPRCPQ